MSQYFEVHPDNPQPRLIKQAVQLLHQGGVCAVPTDSSYALVCHLDDKAAAEALRRIAIAEDRLRGRRVARPAVSVPRLPVTAEAMLATERMLDQAESRLERLERSERAVRA